LCKSNTANWSASCGPPATGVDGFGVDGVVGTGVDGFKVDAADGGVDDFKFDAVDGGADGFGVDVADGGADGFGVEMLVGAAVEHGLADGVDGFGVDSLDAGALDADDDAIVVYSGGAFVDDDAGQLHEGQPLLQGGQTRRAFATAKTVVRAIIPTTPNRNKSRLLDEDDEEGDDTVLIFW